MHSIVSFITGIAIAIGGFFGFTKQAEVPLIEKPALAVERVIERSFDEQMQNEIKAYIDRSLQDREILGAISPIAGNTYNLSGGGVTSSATSLTLQSLTLKQTGQLLVTSDIASTTGIFYITLEPGNNSRQEIVSCTTVAQNTGGTATLSGCIRGLSPIGPYTASTTLQFGHGGGTQVIFSDPPQLFNLYAAKANREVISGLWSFSSTTPPRYDQPPNLHSTGSVVATTSEFASVAYVNATGAGANVSASETVRGEVEIATRTEVASTTATGGTGAIVVIPASAATSSPQNSITDTSTTSGNTYVVVTQDNGRIHPNFVATTSAYNWTGAHTFTQINSVGTSSLATTTFHTPIAVRAIIATSTNASGFGTTTPTGQVSIEMGTHSYPFWIGDTGTTSPALVLTGQGRLGIGTSSPLATTTVNGHIQFGGNKPSLSSCGTAPFVVGNDVVGRITVGTGVTTACTLTFASTWTNPPACFVLSKSTTNAITSVSTITTSLTIGFTADADSDDFSYFCAGFE